MNNIGWEVLPLFSKPLAISTIDDKVSEKLKSLCGEVTWEDDNSETGYNGGWSSNRNILDDHIELKSYFENFSKTCILDIYEYSTDIQVTTSWFTRTLPNGYTKNHSHCNSWFSAVVYFDEYEEESNKLILNTDPPRLLVNKKSDNIFNGYSLTVPPRKNLMVLFPSEMRHETDLNKSNQIRYCLAFNIMPKGDSGIGDSFYTYK